MTLYRLTLAMLVSASLWFGALLLLQALIGSWPSLESWAFTPFALTAIVVALSLCRQWARIVSRDRISWQRHRFF